MSEPLVSLPPLPFYSDDHLASLSAAELWRLLVSDEDRVPRNLIDECARRGDAILDEIENLLRTDYYWDDDITPGEWWLPLHVAMILGLGSSRRAGELLVACMRRLDEAEEEDLQDLLAPFWPALFRNKPETIVPMLRALAGNRAADWYIRACAAEAAIAHAEERSPDRLDEALDWAAVIASDDSEDIEMRAIVATHLIDFARDEDRALIEALADLQEHADRMFDRREVEETYASGGAEREWKRFSDPWLFYDSEIMEERRRRWADEAAALDEEDDLWDEPGQTYVRPAPKVGRNDPCPCGSGKKYKKCCLPKAGED